jgi:hypothetical protein
LPRLLQFVPRLIAVAVLGYVGWLFYSAYYSPDAITLRTEVLLSGTSLNRFEFHEATLAEAVEAYRRALQKAGIRSPQVQVHIAPGVEHNRKPDGQESPPKGSLDLPNIPAIEAGRYLAAIFDLNLKVLGNEVRIQPKEPSRLVHRSFPVPRGFIQRSGPFPQNPDGTLDVSSFLKTTGVSFPEGTWARYRPGSETMEVHRPEEEAQLIDVNFGGCIGPVTWQDRLKSRFGL